MASNFTSTDWGQSPELIPQPPLAKRNTKAAKGKKSDNKKSKSSLSAKEKSRRYDHYVLNDKAPANKNAQIGDFLDRMTFDPANLFPTNSGQLGKFVPTGYKQARVRGTRFDEPPIPFKNPSVQAAVNAADFYVKYNRDNPVGGPYTDKRLYNDPLHRAATQPQKKPHAERLLEGWDALSFDEQQVFRAGGGRWFTDNFLSPGSSSNELIDENIDEFLRISNERRLTTNRSDASPLLGNEAPLQNGVPNINELDQLSDAQLERLLNQWLQNNQDSNAVRHASAQSQQPNPGWGTGLNTLG
jgi:hypothetical protein